MLFIPYALHDRDAYARTAREKFESLGKAGPAAAATPAVPGAAGPVPGMGSRLRAPSGPRQPRGTRAGLGRCGTGSKGSEQQESASDFCLEDVLEASRKNPAANTSAHSREEDFIPIKWHLFILLNRIREHFFPYILNLCSSHGCK